MSGAVSEALQPLDDWVEAALDACRQPYWDHLDAVDAEDDIQAQISLAHPDHHRYLADRAREIFLTKVAERMNAMYQSAASAPGVPERLIKLSPRKKYLRKLDGRLSLARRRYETVLLHLDTIYYDLRGSIQDALASAYVHSAGCSWAGFLAGGFLGGIFGSIFARATIGQMGKSVEAMCRIYDDAEAAARDGFETMLM